MVAPGAPAYRGGMSSYTRISHPSSPPGFSSARVVPALAAALVLVLGCDPAPDDHPPDLDIDHEHDVVTVNGVEIHYVIAGEGDPVVLLPGWPQTWYQWRHVIPELAERYTVIAPDMRGMGDSSRPDGGYDKKTLAEDIHALVEDLGYTEVAVVGHDIGGMVAYAYASLYPDEVTRVAILEAPIPSDIFFQLPAFSPQGGIWWFGLHALPDLPEALITGRERIYAEWFFQNLAVRPEVFTEADIDVYARAMSQPGALRAGFEYYRAFYQDIEDNRMFAAQPLSMPVLAAGGAGATGMLIADMLQPLAEDVTPLVIEDSGHWIPEEQPDLLLEHLVPFLAGTADTP